MQQIYRRIPPRSAISIELQSNFIEIAIQYGYSPINLLQIFRTSFSKKKGCFCLLKKRSIKDISLRTFQKRTFEATRYKAPGDLRVENVKNKAL